LIAHGGDTATDTQGDLSALRNTVSEFCHGAGYRLSPQADEILGDIFHMKEALGDYFCPCQTQKLPETVCVCQPVRQGLVDVMGACFCGLILAN
jgi:ferredoxin-thioredoxin reductase catalytic subunit